MTPEIAEKTGFWEEEVSTDLWPCHLFLVLTQELEVPMGLGDCPAVSPFYSYSFNSYS